MRKLSKLSFAREFDFQAQQTNGADDVEEHERDGVDIFHHRTMKSIRICSCRRCLRYKIGRGVKEFEKRFGRSQLINEYDDMRQKIIEETRRAEEQEMNV